MKVNKRDNKTNMFSDKLQPDVTSGEVLSWGIYPLTICFLSVPVNATEQIKSNISERSISLHATVHTAATACNKAALLRLSLIKAVTGYDVNASFEWCKTKLHLSPRWILSKKKKARLLGLWMSAHMVSR